MYKGSGREAIGRESDQTGKDGDFDREKPKAKKEINGRFQYR